MSVTSHTLTGERIQKVTKKGVWCEVALGCSPKLQPGMYMVYYRVVYTNLSQDTQHLIHTQIIPDNLRIGGIQSECYYNNTTLITQQLTFSMVEEGKLSLWIQTNSDVGMCQLGQDDGDEVCAMVMITRL